MWLTSDIADLGFNLFDNLDEDSDSERKKENVSESDNEGSESKESSGNESDNDGSASESEVKMKTRVIERYHMPVVTSTPNSILSYINWVFILNLWID